MNRRRLPSEEGLLIGGSALLVAIGDEGTGSNDADHTESGSSVGVAVVRAAIRYFLRHGGQSEGTRLIRVHPAVVTLRAVRIQTGVPGALRRLV